MNICEKERKYDERLRREMRSDCCCRYCVALHEKQQQKKSTKQRFACDLIEQGGKILVVSLSLDFQLQSCEQNDSENVVERVKFRW